MEIEATGLDPTVNVVVDEDQQLGEDPTFSHLELVLFKYHSWAKAKETPEGMRRQQALWKLVRSVEPREKAESMGQLSGK